ncbi:carboxypeptidase-like regulatory domain-containing protein, partial [bacterium]|nr:carboxypeptidase-like regulatory domain-containing protein [bacterium]
MNRKAIVAVLFMGLLLAGLSSSVWAGTSGKITGFITDVSTKEPLPGANIIIEGTSLGAATDLNGRFIILNVPPGLFTVRATMMGYREV